MSQHEVLATVSGCLRDASVGLAARVDALRSLATEPTAIRTDFRFVRWRLAGTMQPASNPTVALRPGQWAPGVKVNRRDAITTVVLAAEWFDADVDVLEQNITLAATALAQLCDGLRDYSDAHGGTVIQVLDPMQFTFGEFQGPASSGFTATIQIQERSAL